MSDIATKLTYLNTTKGLIKDSINALGGNLTNQSTFRSYAAALDSIYNVLPKTTGTGTTLSLSPTLKGLMQTTLNGNTYQKTLSGKNLCDENSIVAGNINSSGVYNPNVTAWSTTDYIKLNTNTTYTFSWKPKQTNNYWQTRIVYYDANKDFISTEDFNSYPSDTYYNLSISNDVVYIRLTFTNTGTYERYNLQLELGNEATPYEQYCGGTPSPNPSYPQDINVVSGNNTITICGKNLFDGNIEIGGILDNTGENNSNNTSLRSTGYILVKPNTTYTLSNDKDYHMRIYEYDNNNTFIQMLSTLFQSNATFTTSSNTKYIRYRTIGSYIENDLSSLWQLELGNQTTTYEAYTGATYPINLGSIELCKIGDYKDYFYKQEDKWYLHKETFKSDLYTGATFENHSSTPVDRTAIRFSNKLSLTTYFSNLFIASQMDDSNNPNRLKTNVGTNWYLLLADSLTGIVSSDSNATKLEKMTTYLQNKNAMLYGYLINPTNTEITDTTLKGQLEDIYNANSYVGTTNILQTNNDLPFIIDASCLKGA